MKKTKKVVLELDDLRVESFATDAEMEERGTVHGASLPTRPLCSPYCGETVTCTVEWCC